MMDSNGNLLFSRLRKVSGSVFGNTLNDFPFVEGEDIIVTYQNMRDGVVFTDKRIIVVEASPPNSKRKNYTSFPYRSISFFSSESKGAFDLDSKFCIYVSGIGNIIFQFSYNADFEEFCKKNFRSCFVIIHRQDIFIITVKDAQV